MHQYLHFQQLIYIFHPAEKTKTQFQENVPISWCISGKNITLTLTATAFKAMLVETILGELSPSRSVSTKAPAIPILANFRA